MIDNLVSTIIPVYNRPRLLREAVACVLEQTHRPVEVILVDDGSTDDTPVVCDEMATVYPDLVRVVRQTNAGPGTARESGRKLARGEFLQYLDSDDRLHPRKFEQQVAALRGSPGCGVAYCKTREYTLGHPPTETASFRTGERLEELFPDLLSGRIWQTVTPLFRRTVTDAVGPWSDLRQEEDWEYDARVAALGTRLVWVPEFLADFCHHGGPRAGGNSLHDPAKMRWRAQAHLLIHEHARRAPVSPDDPHLRRYARELFLLARQCGAVGLASESHALFESARGAAGVKGGQRWDYRLYAAAATLMGWRLAGRLACWADRLRSRGPTP